MLELLVSLFIIAFGALGLLALQTRSLQTETESYQRAQALELLNDIAARMSANRDAATCYVTTSLTPAYLGTGTAAPTTCPGGSYSVSESDRATADLAAWQQALLGAGETTTGSDKIGGIADARGCVTVDATTSPPTYTVAVAWQGAVETAAPSNPCAQNLYGADARRRVVTLNLQFARLL